MSDFGCILTFKKGSGSISESDKQAIIEDLDKIIPNSDYSMMIQDGDYKEFYEWDEGVLCVRLTEYYHGEDMDEDMIEFAKEEDLPDAVDIAEKLRLKLGNSFQVEALFADW